MAYLFKGTGKKKKRNRKRTASVRRKGKLFENEIKRSFDHFKDDYEDVMWWERIYDTKDYINKYCPICHAPLSRCASCGNKLPRLGMKVPKRRADFHCGINGNYVLIECKATGVKNGFETALIQTHQWQAMVENQLAGNKSFFFIKSTYSKSNRVYVVTALHLDYETIDYKFISWERLHSIALTTIERTPYHGNPYYNLKFLRRL